MRSLLPVCLALLLPACVLGQVPVQYTLFYPKCPAQGAEAFRRCSQSDGLDNAEFMTSSESRCRDVLNEAVSCYREASLGCLPEDYHGLVQTDAMARDMNSYFCQHKTDFASCFGSKSHTCPGLMSMEDLWNKTVDFVPAMCTYLKGLGNCLKTMSSCSGSAADVLGIYIQKTLPPACGRGSTSVPLASTSLLIPAACALVLLKMAAVL